MIIYYILCYDYVVCTCTMYNAQEEDNNCNELSRVVSIPINLIHIYTTSEVTALKLYIYN